MPEMIKFLASTKNIINKDKNGKIVSHLEITEVVLVHCNFLNNDIYTIHESYIHFFPNKLFGKLLDISPKNFIFFKTFNSEFSYLNVWFTVNFYILKYGLLIKILNH